MVDFAFWTEFRPLQGNVVYQLSGFKIFSKDAGLYEQKLLCRSKVPYWKRQWFNRSCSNHAPTTPQISEAPIPQI